MLHQLWYRYSNSRLQRPRIAKLWNKMDKCKFQSGHMNGYCMETFLSDDVQAMKRFSCSEMCTSVRSPESHRLLRGEAPRKRSPGDSKDAREAKFGDTKLSNILHFKYLGVMQSGDVDNCRQSSDCDLLVQICRPQTASGCFETTKKPSPTPAECSSHVHILLYGCES